MVEGAFSSVVRNFFSFASKWEVRSISISRHTLISKGVVFSDREWVYQYEQCFRVTHGLLPARTGSPHGSLSSSSKYCYSSQCVYSHLYGTSVHYQKLKYVWLQVLEVKQLGLLQINAHPKSFKTIKQLSPTAPGESIVSEVSQSTDLWFCSRQMLASWNEMEDFQLDP